jgi:hypothetical protein
VDDAGDELAPADRGADRDGVPREAVEEVRGAVERVDDEGQPLADDRARVVALLAEERASG